MQTLLVTAYPSIHDVILLEPTLEALYYKNAPCRMVLRTWEGFFPFFEHHPLIHELIKFESGVEGFEKAVELCSADIGIDIDDTTPLLLPTVERFAALSEVLLTRKTPWICLPDRPADTNTVVVTNTAHELQNWPGQQLMNHLGGGDPELVILENPKSIGFFPPSKNSTTLLIIFIVCNSKQLLQTRLGLICLCKSVSSNKRGLGKQIWNLSHSEYRFYI